MLSSLHNDRVNIKEKPNHPVNGLLGFLPSTKEGALVWAFAFLYAPLAFTYFWNPDVGHSWKLQDVVIEWFTSKEFSGGKGSGYDGHQIFYQRAVTRMLLHSVAGSLVTTVGLLQFSDSLRSRYPGAHRLAGYFYMLCAFVIPMTSAWFLISTGSKNIFSGPSFALILWLLLLGTLMSAAAALYEAAIAHRFERHRDMMAYNYALMLSAPLLRYGWVIVHQFWPETKETINMTEGLWAGPFLFSCAIYYIRSKKGSRPQLPRASLPRWMPRAFTAIAALGSAYLAWNIPGTTMWRPEVLFWWTTPVITLQAIAFVLLYRRASQTPSNKTGAQQYWATNIMCLYALPGWCAVSFAVTRHLLDGSVSESWYGAFMGGMSFACFAAGALNIYFTKYIRDFPQAIERTQVRKI